MTNVRTSGLTIGTGCTNYNSVSITVAESGTIVVNANVFVSLNHVSGTKDYATFHVGTAAGQCSAANNMQRVAMVSASAPTDVYDSSVSVEQFFSVSAGTHTFFLNAKMSNGQDNQDKIEQGNLRLSFYAA